jgi:hypothetical protein
MAVRNTHVSGPILLYELNEVPWRVVDWYIGERPRSNFANVLRSAETYTSLTLDEGELHPWVTWPTLHRSVYASTHGIRYINQDLTCARDYPPLWEKIAAAGKRVGVFGSLQSYPPPARVPFAFYVPDTFAPGPETIPARYECFQRFNLRQTQADRAIAQPLRLHGGLFGDVIGLCANGLRLRTIARLAAQLLRERKNPVQRVRRPILQAPVAFDVFRHALRRAEPDFCTFFTNHVAGIMHRYWKYAFPEDFDYEPQGEVDRFHRESLLIALDDADEQIGFLKRYVDERGGRLYIASSMGQEAIHQEHEIEVVIKDMPAFVAAIGFRQPLTPRAAMHPDYSFEFESEELARDFAARVAALRRADGTPAFFTVQSIGKTASCAAGSGKGFEREGEPLRLTLGDGSKVLFEQAGLDVMERDVGTGYHQPKGILLRYGAGVAARDDRALLASVRIAGMIMEDLGICPAPEPARALAVQEPALTSDLAAS